MLSSIVLRIAQSLNESAPKKLTLLPLFKKKTACNIREYAQDYSIDKNQYRKTIAQCYRLISAIDKNRSHRKKIIYGLLSIGKD